MNKNSHELAVIEEAPAIADRPDVPGGFWNRAWPILALAIITLLLVRACLPAAPSSSAAPAFHAAAAAKTANDNALAALTALPPGAATEDIVKALNLISVNFAPGSADIPADAQPVLAKAAAVIGFLPASFKLEVGGHTDDTGANNAALSHQRAQAVVAFLAANAVASGRLVARGYGSSQPVAVNATEEGRFRNRRIEFSPAQP